MSLYCYNQPQKFGKYDLHLDGKLYVNEVITKSGSIGEYELTAEDVKKVVPIAFGTDIWGYAPSATRELSISIGDYTRSDAGGIAIGGASSAYQFSVVVGAYAVGGNNHTTVVGRDSKAYGGYSLNFGMGTQSNAYASITIGGRFYEQVDGATVLHKCSTYGTGSITIGAGANTLNSTTTNSDGTTTTVGSSNSITIGCKANNTAADSIVIGAQASNASAGFVVIGTAATSKGRNGVAIGRSATAENGVAIGFSSVASITGSTALGNNAKAAADYSVALGQSTSAQAGAVAIGSGAVAMQHSNAIGYNAYCKQAFTTAIGSRATAADYGVVVHRSTAEDGTVTQLYFSGANTPLATTYEGGEAMMGYVTKDKDGNVLAAGTNKLSALFPNNSTFAPATINELGETITPIVFHPSDLDIPVEEEPEIIEEEYTPLPVYPIVEPDLEELQ